MKRRAGWSNTESVRWQCWCTAARMSCWGSSRSRRYPGGQWTNAPLCNKYNQKMKFKELFFLYTIKIEIIIYFFWMIVLSFELMILKEMHVYQKHFLFALKSERSLILSSSSMQLQVIIKKSWLRKEASRVLFKNWEFFFIITTKSNSNKTGFLLASHLFGKEGS